MDKILVDKTTRVDKMLFSFGQGGQNAGLVKSLNILSEIFKDVLMVRIILRLAY